MILSVFGFVFSLEFVLASLRSAFIQTGQGKALSVILKGVFFLHLGNSNLQSKCLFFLGYH